MHPKNDTILYHHLYINVHSERSSSGVSVSYVRLINLIQQKLFAHQHQRQTKIQCCQIFRSFEYQTRCCRYVHMYICKQHSSIWLLYKDVSKRLSSYVLLCTKYFSYLQKLYTMILSMVF